ncbi:MAG: hypothetical protein QXN15_05710 [Candidatus Jordarchaeales archaeon]
MLFMSGFGGLTRISYGGSERRISVFTGYRSLHGFHEEIETIAKLRS